MWQNIFGHCAKSEVQKNRKLRSGVVLLCWILLHKTFYIAYDMPRDRGHNMGITFGRPAPLTFSRAKKTYKIQRDF